MQGRTIALRRLAILCLPLLFTGCGLPPAVVALSYAMDGISYVSSGKSVTDHALSAAADQDCAMFRVIQGRDICNAGDTDDTATFLAKAEDKPAPADGVTNPASRTEAALANRAQALSWNIRAGRDVSIVSARAVATRVAADPTVISPNRPPVKFNASDGHPKTAHLRHFPASTEVFALLQENGALEIFAYGPKLDGAERNLALIATYENYADNPSLLEGVSIGSFFHPIGDLIV